jgi:hypothetical protein
VGPPGPAGTGIVNTGNAGYAGYYAATGTTISSGQGATVYAGDFAANSDLRLKDVSGKIEDAMARVTNLEGVKYTWNQTASDRLGLPVHVPQVGLIAQDVLEVLPEAVKQDDGFYLVSYDKVVPLLVEAIKELNERIKELESR